MTRLTIVTTCKGRLAHLRQSLPRMADQPDTSCVVVDYACPDGCGDWTAAEHPNVNVVRVENAAGFNAGHARNLGAAAADSPWLAFIDADILLAPDFAAAIAPLLDGKRYFRPAPLLPDTWGTCIVPAPDFRAIGGFDETLSAWGGEDDDLYWRLRMLQGLQPATFDGRLVAALEHSDADRIRNPGDPARWTGHRANALYLHIKYDMMRLTGQRELPRALRTQIFDEVRRSVLADEQRGATTTRITVSLPSAEPEVPLWGYRLKRQWIFDLERIPGTPQTPF